MVERAALAEFCARGAQVIGANQRARALLPDLTLGTNLARRFFQERLYWSNAGEEFAQVAVARLAAATRYPAYTGLHRLITELQSASGWFNDLWSRDPTSLPARRSKTIQHPDLGPVPVTCDILLVPEDDQQVVFVTPEPDTAVANALRSLGTAS